MWNMMWPSVAFCGKSMRGRRWRYGLCTRSVMVVAFFCCAARQVFFLWHGFHHGAGLGTSILATLGYATSRNGGGGGGFTAMRRAGRAARRRCCRPFCLWPPQHIGSKYLTFVPRLCIRWVSVVEFHDPTLIIGKVFGQESTVVKWNYYYVFTNLFLGMCFTNCTS